MKGKKGKVVDHSVDTLPADLSCLLCTQLYGGETFIQDVMPAYWPWLVHTEFMSCPVPLCLHSCSSGQKDTGELCALAVHDRENKRVHFLAADSALQVQHKNFLKGRKKCSEENPGVTQ